MGKMLQDHLLTFYNGGQQMKGTVIKYQTKKGIRYRYVVDIGTGSERKQKKKSGFLKKKDAQESLRKLLVEIDKGTYLEPCKIPFKEFAEKWFLNCYAKRIKITTFISRKYLLEKHLIEENPFSNKALSKITVEDIDSFYNLKLDEGYSTSYIRKMHQMLNRAFNQAIKWNKLPI